MSESVSLKELSERATPGAWKHYYEVFRPQFGRRRITELQRADGKPIVRWSGFDGLPSVTDRKVNANVAFICMLVREYRAGRFHTSEDLAAAHAKGRAEGIGEAAELVESRYSDFIGQAGGAAAIEALSAAASDIRALLPTTGGSDD